MTEVALITDTHCGVRDSSLLHQHNQEQFYEEVFFPSLLERGVKTVFHLGDVFDRRKYINFRNLKSYKEYFLDKLVEHDIHMYVIAGNHDIYYKNTNEVNSVNLLMHEYSSHVTCVDQDCLDLGDVFDKRICMIPWINEENFDKLIGQVKQASPDILMGHFEFSGFEMHRGAVIDHGMSPSLFSDVHMVLSGHYHHKSKKGNVQYLGAPFEYTWSDCNDPRGFHFLNTSTFELTFVQNPFVLFHKLTYDDTVNSTDTLPDVSHLKNKYVKLIVANKQNPYAFDLYISHIDSVGPHDFQILDLSVIDYGTTLTDKEIEAKTKDTQAFLSDYVNSLNYVDKSLRERTTGILDRLYRESTHT